MRLELTTGSIFANYRIEGLVGRGGMGVVYRATDLRLERPVALKLIAPELAEDKRFRSRFLRESRVAASLDHRGVVPIYEAGDEDGQLFIAMRYVEGEDLETLREGEGTLAAERTVAILGQVADALDAAHDKGLVHRDVKPGNVLLDAREHAFLTDFGVTKQVGGASTETGQVVGTFDYLAPEQIRGGAVDARTDCYALACVLYECLAGNPPFRRPTEAETLWAHMQEEPPRLRAYPELDPVLQKALAKEKDERYASCGDFLTAAASALGLETRARRARRVRIGRRLVAAGATLALAAAALLVAVTMLDDEPAPVTAVGSAVAAVGRGGDSVASYTETEAMPANIAVGEGAVWLLNPDDRTITKIDPRTKTILERFTSRAVPTDLAVGAGAVWVGNGGGRDEIHTVSVSRVDPRTGGVTNTVTLSGANEPYFGFPSEGTPGIAIGAGAVWAANPDGTISRLDPRTGAHVATIQAGGHPIAAGREGVWFLRDGPSVVNIDARTNKVGQTIPISTASLESIAVGAGSVWAVGREQGLVWRIELGAQPAIRPIDVGVGASYVSFGEGSAWVANSVEGTVSRIDPSSNEVTKIRVAGAPQSLAVGLGSAWVGVDGGTDDGALPRSVCGAIESGGRDPDVLIASDLVLQGAVGAPRAMADAIRFVLRRHGYRAGRHDVGYQSCDDSTAQAGGYELRRCAANANAYAQAPRLVAVIGPYNSGCAQVEIPILNRADGGPIAIVGPITTHSGLTRPGPGTSRGEPGIYYPTGVRNYMTLGGNHDFQGAAVAVLAKQLDLRRVYVLHDGPASGGYGIGLATAFRRAAARLGVTIVGYRAWDPAASSYDALAARVALSRADGVFVAGFPFTGGDPVVKALRTRLGRRVRIIAPDAFPVEEALRSIGPAAHGMYLIAEGVLPEPSILGPAGRRFVRQFGVTPSFGTPFAGLLEAAQAADIVLQAIASSDGTRGSVLRELRRVRVKDGLLGSFSFNRWGEISPAAFTILRVTGSSPNSVVPGAVVDRLVRVPGKLAGR